MNQRSQSLNYMKFIWLKYSMKKGFYIFIDFKNERKTPMINKTDGKAEEQPI